MATVTARTLHWYSPPRVKQAMRQARRLPVVPVALLTFLLLIPALLAPLVAPYDPLKGSLAEALEAPGLGRGRLLRDIFSAPTSSGVTS